MKTIGVILYIVNFHGGVVLHDDFRTMEQCREAKVKTEKEMAPRDFLRLVCVPHYDFPEPQG